MNHPKRNVTSQAQTACFADADILFTYNIDNMI